MLQDPFGNCFAFIESPITGTNWVAKRLICDRTDALVVLHGQSHEEQFHGEFNRKKSEKGSELITL
jgi:hypothetical protein